MSDFLCKQHVKKAEILLIKVGSSFLFKFTHILYYVIILEWNSIYMRCVIIKYIHDEICKTL